jgi:rhodanese-related sulfurtransferase
MKIPRNVETIGLAAVLALSLSGPALAEGSRYDLPRDYDSEISPAKAYLEMGAGDSVLIDVRRLKEYRAGHPYDDASGIHAYNAPYPNRVGSGDATPQELYDEVYDIIFNREGGDENTPITTLCRTGFRSVLAGNILANPSAYGITGPAFTNVRNIWEGFVGRYKEANVNPLGYDPDEEGGVGHIPRGDDKGKKGVPHTLLAHEELHHKYLDLNNDDVLSDDVADVCTEQADMNPDKDGWRNFQELPTSTAIVTQYAYQQNVNFDQYTTCTAPAP